MVDIQELVHSTPNASNSVISAQSGVCPNESAGCCRPAQILSQPFTTKPSSGTRRCSVVHGADSNLDVIHFAGIRDHSPELPCGHLGGVRNQLSWHGVYQSRRRQLFAAERFAIGVSFKVGRGRTKPSTPPMRRSA